MDEMMVYYDGHCPFCVRSMNLIRSTDKIGLVKFTSIHDLKKPDLPDQEDLLKRSIVVKTNDGKTFTGMHAILKILLRIPELFIVTALVFFLNTIGIGEIIYSKISASRYSMILGRCNGKCGILETRSK